MRIPTEHSMTIPTIFSGIGAIIVIAVIIWLASQYKKETFITARNGKCPRGTLLKYRTRGGKKIAVCIAKKSYNFGKHDASVASQFPYWGWGNHTGLRCKNPDNTGCNTAWRDGRLYIKK